jgi:hypothetical protein
VGDASSRDADAESPFGVDDASARVETTRVPFRLE